MMAAAYILWCGICWTLRGGWFGALVRRYLRVEPGTTVTRIACAGLMAAPLALAVGPWALALWASIYVAMTIGYFDDAMGLEQPGRDHLWLAAWGVCVAALAIMPLAARDPWALAWAPLGTLAVAAYASQKPLGRRRFGWDWTERAEFLTGCALGAALFGAAT